MLPTSQTSAGARHAGRQTAEERNRTTALRQGSWHPLVDAGPSRDHLMRLRQHGVGLDQIVRISQTPKRTIRRVLETATSPHRIRTETAERVLAIQIRPEHVAPRSQVDATQTHALIQALVAAGHSLPELARAMGKNPVSLRRSLNRRTVTARTAASVSSLYDGIQGKAFASSPNSATRDNIGRENIDFVESS